MSSILYHKYTIFIHHSNVDFYLPIFTALYKKTGVIIMLTILFHTNTCYD